MIFADIFSCEYRDGFISIQRSTVFGRRRVLKIKLMLSVIITVLIFTVCEGIQYFYVARYTGLPSPLAPAAGAPCLSCTEDISIIGCFLLTFLRQLTAGIIITLLTAFVSRFTKKPLPTAALMICVAFAPAALSYFGFDFLNAVSPVLLTGRA